MTQPAQWDVAEWDNSYWDVEQGTFGQPPKKKKKLGPFVPTPPIPREIFESFKDYLEAKP